MRKKILFVIPDYSSTTLRMLKTFEKLQYDIHIVVPYKFSFFARILLKISPSKPFFKKIKRRNKDWQKNKPQNYKLISTTFLKLLHEIYIGKKAGRFVFSNVLKEIIQTTILKKINFSDYDYYYTFDTCAMPYLKRAKEKKKKTILECRGNQIDFALNVNKNINQRYGTSLDSTDSYLDNEDLYHWYMKIRKEPEYADLLVVYSTFQIKQFPNNKIIKIPIVSSFDKKSEIKSADKTIRFLFVGRVVLSKGFAVLMEAWKIIVEKYKDNDIELNIVGSYRKETENFINNLPPKVIYWGHLFEKDLKDKFKENHVFIFPTFMDTYGIVIQEAISYNMPIITTSNCGGSEYVKEGKTGFIYKNVYSELDLSNLIEKFILKPNLVKQMSLEVKKQNVIDEKSIESIISESFEKKLS